MPCSNRGRIIILFSSSLNKSKILGGLLGWHGGLNRCISLRSLLKSTRKRWNKQKTKIEIHKDRENTKHRKENTKHILETGNQMSWWWLIRRPKKVRSYLSGEESWRHWFTLQKLEKTQELAIPRAPLHTQSQNYWSPWMNIMWYIHNGIIFSTEKKWSIKLWKDIEET